MKFVYISIFPDYFHDYFRIGSIVKRAQKNGLLSYKVYNIRDFSRNNKVDDYPYGGGRGMVLKIDPIVNAINEIKNINPNAYFILMTPRAKIFSQSKISKLLSVSDELVFICGRYEGIDERIMRFIDDRFSVGSFITMGGEIPSLLMTEAIIRSIPGVIEEKSYKFESFSDKNEEIFDFPCYTRPKKFGLLSVPDILLSGNHKEIEKWREKMRKFS